VNSYDQNQMDVDLVVCANCRRATYMRRPCYAICLACRTGAPPIGPVIPASPAPPKVDAQGNSMAAGE
jgi:hypothetical protein